MPAGRRRYNCGTQAQRLPEMPLGLGHPLSIILYCRVIIDP